MNISTAFKDKKVLVTGHTGFKGSWLALWLRELGAYVIGVSSDIPTEPSNYKASNLKGILTDYKADVRDSEKIKSIVENEKPDFVFHLAAQALVRPAYQNPIETMTTNALGTISVLDSLRNISKPVVAVMITSDKVYHNCEWVWGYRETDQLGGKDPYSASKGMAELAIRSYIDSYFSSKEGNVKVGIARAGNVIGGGDWAVDRIVPDCMRAWSQSESVDIRYPNATRPWQHVLEPLSGYLSLGVELASSNNYHGEAYNYGPAAEQDYSVRDLIREMMSYWRNVRWKDVSREDEYLPEAGLLKLNCDKALSHLNWRPTLEFNETVRMTVEWYKQYYESGTGQDMQDLSISQIKEYIALAKSRFVCWAED